MADVSVPHMFTCPPPTQMNTLLKVGPALRTITSIFFIYSLLANALIDGPLIMLCHCSSAMTKNHFLLISFGTKWPLCVGVGLNTYSSIFSAGPTLRDTSRWLINVKQIKWY